MLSVSNRQALLALAVGLLLAPSAPARQPAFAAELPVVKPNDNRVAAGTRRGDTLTLNLVVNRARWFPGAADGQSVVVEALAEEGKAPQIPAPLIRVPAGTHIVATVRNLGEAVLPAGVPVSFYVGQPPGTQAGILPTQTALYPFEAEELALDVAPLSEDDVIYAIVDEGGVHPEWAECRTDNNQSEVVTAGCNIPQ